MSKEIRIMIADDHPIVRSGLRTVIEADPLLRVVAEADNGEAALASIVELQPDVAVLDINMPPPDGLTVARQLRQRQSPVEIIFMTMHRGNALLDAAVELGVKGFIVKEAAINEIVRCITAVAAGEIFFSPALTAELVGKQQTSPLKNLTTSERRILTLVGEAKTNKEIAELMFLSVRTVEHHRSNICTKLGITGKNALLMFALAHKNEF